MSIKLIPLPVAVDLRHKILRPHQFREDCIYPGDSLPGAAHFGVYQAEVLMGIGSVYPEGRDQLPSARSWRLRGMAVLPEYRSKGFGGELLLEIIDFVRAKGGESLWCNARRNAYQFYTKLGFTLDGDEFDIESIGPHSVMTIEL